jgi:mannose/fructose/N-acetylgalactosamine-specific phosphotransferase system component IIC
MHDVWLIALIGGLLAIDERAGWQSLLGEPVFSALIVGVVTHQVHAAAIAGVALQFIWLSIGAARGTRRPNVVVGGLVGSGAACIVLKQTGDPRVAFVVATGVFCGLLAAEAGVVIAGAAGELRGRWLARFRLPDSPEAASRNLTLVVVGSVLFVALVDAISVLGLLPIAVGLTDTLTEKMPGIADGARLWLAVAPALAIATVARAFGSRTLGRYALLGLLVAGAAVWLL